ncbi:MAG: two-component regulator propeller domain-containing protein [Reichenbachiella sp.]|uniref:ligand-binding sensor domain-containing protein n=1 Tax=Reichenbachiella sp. TaxID=2184521 RepID=UPI003262CCF5
MSSSMGRSQELHFKRYSADDGLSQITIQSIYQDKKDFMWFGTRNGLNLFDGHNFTTYYHNPWDSTTLPNNSIQVITGGTDHDIWIGTADGLCLYKQKKDVFQSFGIPNANQSNWTIHDLALDNNGTLWIASEFGLFYLGKGDREVSRVQITPNQDIKENQIFVTILKINNGDVWVGGGSGLFNLVKTDTSYRLSKQNLHTKNLEIKNVSDLYQDENNDIWLTTRESTFRYRLGAQKVEQFQNVLKKNTQKTSFEGRNITKGLGNSIWVSGYKGIFVFDLEKKSFVDRISHNPSDPFSLSDNSIHALFVDQVGDRWIGTYSGGLNFYSQNQESFRLTRQSNLGNLSINSNIINAFTEGPDGKLYIGTSRGGLNIYDPKSKTYQYDITQTNIRSLIFDSKNNLWIGTFFDGLIHYDINNNEARFYQDYPLDYEGNLERITTRHTPFIDSEKNLWVGQWNFIYLYEPETDTFQKFEHPLNQFETTARIRQIVQVENNLWVLSTTGIHIFDLNERRFIKNYVHEPGNQKSLPSNTIVSMVQDKNGMLWVGSYGGLSKFSFELENFENFDISNGLPSNMIACLLVDETNRVWISTSNGLALYDQREKTFTQFGNDNNIQSHTFRDRACYSCSNGDFLFGGNNGFNRIDPNQVVGIIENPGVELTNFSLFNEPQTPAKDAVLSKQIQFLDTLSLDYHQNVFSISYTAMDYSDADKNKYSYKLEGFDENWNEVGYKRTATYTNLSPGTYYFKVKTSNGIFNPDDPARQLTIIVVPPFWMTGEFKFLLFVLTTLGILAIHRLRVRKLRKQRAWLDKKVLVRTRVIDEQKTELEEKNKRLEEAQEEIRTANDQLQEINDHLEEKVVKRTNRITMINQKIKEYAFLNSHKVRAPIVRILGLVNLYDSDTLSSQEISEVNANIKNAAHELESITKKINNALDADIDK